MTHSTIEKRYREHFGESKRLYELAVDHFPGGVTHDSRSMQPFPVYVQRAEGARKWDVQGHEFVDWVAGHGSLLLGHGRREVVEAVQRQMGCATHPGASHELEVRWAQLVRQLVPSVRRMRFVSSGTEAVMMALRLSRTFTRKPKVLRFLGHFHGWSDAVIQDANPPYGMPVPGLVFGVRENLVSIAPNDIVAVESTLRHDQEIGCVILEPTGGHFGEVPLGGAFLHELRRITQEHGVLLVFDEVITGFRVHPGGAQGHYEVEPDLSVMAKVVAGGLPGACVGGREDIMSLLQVGQPVDRKMPHPGTFNANPLSASAGIAALQVVQTGEPCRRANEMGRLLRTRLNELFCQLNVNWIAYGEFSRIKLLMDYEGPRPDDLDAIPYDGDFQKLDANPPEQVQNAFRLAMLLNGVDCPGNKCISMAAHTEDDVDQTVEAVRETIVMFRREGL